MPAGSLGGTPFKLFRVPEKASASRETELRGSVFSEITFSLAAVNAWGEEGGDALTGESGGASCRFFGCA